MSLTLVVAAAFLTYVAIPAFGNKALIVRSGSMQPAIGVGDLVVVRGNDQIAKPISALLPKYKVGDIVAFSSEHSASILTTHRIASIENQEGRIVYQTKGDANDSPDENLIAEDKILGKSIFTIVGLGKVFALAKTKQGFLSLVVAPAILVILFELYSIFREIIRIRRKNILPDIPEQTTWQSSPNNILLKVLLPFVIGIMFFQGSFASYADVETASGNSLQAAEFFSQEVPPPSGPNDSPAQSPIPLANHVVISEVQINGGPGDAEHDFIELYNPTNSSFELNGHRLVRRSGNSVSDSSIKSWTTSTLIPAHGFYLWANNSDSTFPEIIGADTSTSVDLTASHSIALRNGALDTGVIIDALSWNDGSTLGEGDEFDPDPGGGESMERKAFSTSTASSMNIGGVDEFKGNSFDANSNATDFTLRLVSDPQSSSDPSETP